MNKIKFRVLNLFSTSDRAGRIDHFLVNFFSVLPLILFIKIEINQNFLGIYFLFFFIVFLCNIARRLNDLGKKLSYGLLILVPIVGIVFYWYLWFWPGKNNNK